MIIEKRIKEFEKLGLGMFVHFGLYSQLGKGEWPQHRAGYLDEEQEGREPGGIRGLLPVHCPHGEQAAELHALQRRCPHRSRQFPVIC